MVVLHGLREAFYMLWDTLWALVLGFALSGAVQAFASRQGLRRRLGDHGPAAVARATVYGVVSSSCSYAAAAMARSLWRKGADFVSATVFMFASTNLVLELGLVLLVLIGWPFVAAEFAGGALMIVLLVAAGHLWLRSGPPREPGDGEEPSDGQRSLGWRTRARTRDGWADAAGYAVGDLTMLRRELAIGFLAAGILTAAVPGRVWSDAFISGHGWPSSVENALVGPLVAVASCVCSVGNIPLAATLWKGGISFGGVVAFVFADLVSLPLLLVYRRQYGWRTAARMFVVFWAVMSAAGLVTGYVFGRVGWIPARRPGPVVGDTLRWNATTVADLVALVVLAGLWWLARTRATAPGERAYATDPVCGMQVEKSLAPARATVGGTDYWFCCEGCRDAFTSAPTDARGG